MRSYERTLCATLLSVATLFYAQPSSTAYGQRGGTANDRAREQMERQRQLAQERARERESWSEAGKWNANGRKSSVDRKNAVGML